MPPWWSRFYRAWPVPPAPNDDAVAEWVAGTATTGIAFRCRFCRSPRRALAPHAGILAVRSWYGARTIGIMPIPRTARPSKPIDTRIQILRGERVMLDSDLAAVYDVSTSHLNQAVKRNRRRFPPDFAFQLTAREVRNLRSQSVISSSSHGGRRTKPWAFTEHGAMMAASVLNTPRAIQMSVFVVRAFARLRELAVAHGALKAQLVALERRVTGHDEELACVIATLRSLLSKPVKSPRQIGFTAAMLPPGPAPWGNCADAPRTLLPARRRRIARGTIHR